MSAVLCFFSFFSLYSKQWRVNNGGTGVSKLQPYAGQKKKNSFED